MDSNCSIQLLDVEIELFVSCLISYVIESVSLFIIQCFEAIICGFLLLFKEYHDFILILSF